MTGEELLRQIRTSEGGEAIPFIMISSRGDRDHIIKAIQSGVSDYLSKPFSPDELLRKVFKQLKKDQQIARGQLARCQHPGHSRRLSGRANRWPRRSRRAQTNGYGECRITHGIIATDSQSGARCCTQGNRQG